VIEVRTAGKLGYCSGVSQAIEKALEYGDQHGKVFSLGTVAHNEDVVALLKEHGVEPISIDDMKLGTSVVITAHGAPPDTYEQIHALNCEFLDCTCPIVKKAQDRAKNLAAEGFDIVIFGDPEHQEVKGIVGWSKGSCKFVGHQNQLFTPGQEHIELNLGPKVGVLSQTTKDPSDYREFLSTLLEHHGVWSPDVRVCHTICPIVTELIEDTRKLAGEVDMMFVVGSKESANTRNLERVCLQAFCKRPSVDPMVKSMVNPGRVNLVQSEEQVGPALMEFFQGGTPPSINMGVTAGTSTPIEVVARVVARLKEIGLGN